jgi:hypothetical protein
MFLMRHSWPQPSGSVDLDHAALGRWGDFRAFSRRHRYLAATRHPALPGSNAPVGSSRISRCRHDGRLPTSLKKFGNDRQRWHTLPRAKIASHVSNTGELRLRVPIGVP